MDKSTEFYYNNRYCPECGGHQKNCEHFWAGYAVGQKFAEVRIIKLLKIGGPIEKIICDYWGNDDYDKDDALAMIELAIKGETE